MKGEIEKGAFITSESGDDGYKVVIRCSSLEAAHKAHRAVLELVYEVQHMMALPEGWKAELVKDNGVSGYIIRAPRISGTRHNSAVFEDSDNLAERMLYLMLASRKGVES